MDLSMAVVKEEAIEAVEGVDTPVSKKYLETPDVKIEYEETLRKEMEFIDATLADLNLRKVNLQVKLDKFNQ